MKVIMSIFGLAALLFAAGCATNRNGYQGGTADDTYRDTGRSEGTPVQLDHSRMQIDRYR